MPIDDDDDSDDFSLDDEAALAAQRAPGLVVPMLSPGDSIGQAEERMRKAGALIPCLFVDVTESGEEIWAGEQHAEAIQKAMDWPCRPTVDEAVAWQANRVAVAAYREWQKLYGSGAAA
ncbi:hypothetical protein ACVSQB_32960 [Bradyrhizobium elkanii]